MGKLSGIPWRERGVNKIPGSSSQTQELYETMKIQRKARKGQRKKDWEMIKKSWFQIQTDEILKKGVKIGAIVGLAVFIGLIRPVMALAMETNSSPPGHSNSVDSDVTLLAEPSPTERRAERRRSSSPETTISVQSPIPSDRYIYTNAELARLMREAHEARARGENVSSVILLSYPVTK